MIQMTPRPTPPSIRSDLTGNKYGKWTVLGFWERTKGQTRWLCRCECGTVKSVGHSNLISDNSLSCGLCRETVTDDPLYHVWHRIKDRSVDEWQSFAAFRDCIGDRPSGDLILCRKDPREPHGPGNTIWAKRGSDQEIINRRKPDSQRAIGEICGITKQRVNQLLKKMTVEQILQRYKVKTCGTKSNES